MSCFYEGKTFWADEQCHRLCVCDRNLSAVVCHNSSCAVRESCTVVNGSRSCQPVSRPAVCTGSVDPHYRTFDGFHFDFQGTCVYQLAALCINNTSLVPFNVTVKNDRLSHAVSFTHTVNVTVNGFTITLTREHPYRLLVSTVTQYTLIGLRTILVQIQFYFEKYIYIKKLYVWFH